jgi:ParB family chromosome partitioning protein
LLKASDFIGFSDVAKAENEARSTDYTTHVQGPGARVSEPFGGTGVETDHIAPDLRALAFPVTDLRPDDRNARQHGERSIAAIAASLLAHGQRKPIVAKRTYRGLSNVVLAGNGTLQAARQLGWRRIAVTWFDGSDDQALAYALRDNKTGDESHFDNQQLAALASEGVDLLSLGWRADELGDLLALADADAVPLFEPEQPVGRLDRLSPHCATCRCREPKS